ncbi:hypothetical protein PRK78_000405 [Emydomyces testavorans]|uniref:Uncharacterized protein n=1 Tax=Emydomyces testavorans TaxID=2070801 RepID=A0AAF0DB14_9EURO|nr:hypothetical protein PRK78_000405 [Emydomyces testavorans]
MTQTQQSSFQLFPNVQPHNHPQISQPRKWQRRYSSKSPTVSPVIEDVKSTGQTEAVILQIIEDTNVIVPPLPARAARAKSPATAPISGESRPAIATQIPWDRRTPSPSLTSRAQSPPSYKIKNDQTKGRSFSTPSPAPSSLRSPSPTMLQDANGGVNHAECAQNPQSRSSPSPFSCLESPRCGSSASACSHTGSPQGAKESTHTQMKSLFPLYDPDVPLCKQKYYPHRSSSLPQIIIPSTEQKHSPPSIPVIPKAASCLSVARNENVSFSSADELTRLWDASNGEASQAKIGIFHLRMWKVDAFTFAFGSRSTPFYTLRTNPMNDLEIHRTHPSKPNTKSPVVTLNIGDLSRETPAGIALTLFPKLAEILTREQALELARRNQLAPQHAMEAENDALQKSEAQNSCVLELRPAQNRYNLFHPALAGCGITSAADCAIPQPLNGHSGLLHATVSTSLPNTIAMRQYPRIQITAPNRNMNHNTPLIVLDLETMALSIFAEQILSTIPSFYSIDTVVAAILTIAVSNETSKSIFASMSIRSSRPTGFPDPYRPDSPRPESTTGKAGIQFIATQAEREEAEQEATLMEQIRSKPRFQSKHRFSLMSILHRKSANDEITEVRTKKNKRKAKQPVLVEEIDLERYGDSDAHTSQALPRPTRALLKFIFWIFSTIVWLLTMGAKFMVWVVISMTKCLTREKY